MPDARHVTSPTPVASIEESVGRLVGVESVRVVAAAGGGVDAIHVVMGPAWRADTLTRDVQALLLHRFDLEVDTEVVHVTQQPQQVRAAPDAPPPARRQRPALAAVHIVLRPESTSVDVELHTAGQRLTGSARLADPASLPTAVAEATLAAIEGAVDCWLEAAGVDVVQVDGDRIALVTVVATDGRSEQRMTGSALVREHVEDAMARAALDATNSLHRQDRT